MKMKRSQKLMAMLLAFLIFTSLQSNAKNPVKYRLSSGVMLPVSNTIAYPNPFTESTTIFFTPSVNEVIRLKLYTVKGQLIDELFDDKVEKGEMYRFELSGKSMKPGVYYYTIETDGKILHQRIELVK
jgi:hypothetical protein